MEGTWDEGAQRVVRIAQTAETQELRRKRDEMEATNKSRHRRDEEKIPRLTLCGKSSICGKIHSHFEAL